MALLVAVLVLVPVALAVPGNPRPQLNAADNRTAAQLVVLKTDLLPVYHADATGYAATGVYHCPGVYMPDRSGVTYTGSAEHAYSNGVYSNGMKGVGSNSVGSSATVFKTAADLDLYWRATVRPAFAKCAAFAYSKTHAPGVRGKVISAGSYNIGPTGVSKTAAFRIRLLFSDKAGQTESVERTIVFLGTGRTLAQLSFADVEYRCDCSGPITRKIAMRMIVAGRG